MEIKTVQVDSLASWNRNPREAVNLERLKKLLTKRGQLMPLLLDGRDMKTVLGGNMRLKAICDLGWNECVVSIVHPEDDKDAAEIALEDNEIFGKYLKAQLVQLVEEFDIDTNININMKPMTLRDVVLHKSSEEEQQDNEIPEAKPVTTLGDLYELNGHRILCADSNQIESIEKLVNGVLIDAIHTDPPYGISLNTDWTSINGKKYNAVIGDDEQFDPSKFLSLFEYVKEQFWWGADYYSHFLPMRSGSLLVWDKRSEDNFQSAGNPDKMIGSMFEICYSKNKHRREIIRYRWAGSYGLSREDTDGRVHPTQKPVGMVEMILTKYTKEGDKVLDFFLGSGSTLIACEKTKRICYGIELDPKYIDQIVNRWCNFTGQYDIIMNGKKLNWRHTQDG